VISINTNNLTYYFGNNAKNYNWKEKMKTLLIASLLMVSINYAKASSSEVALKECSQKVLTAYSVALNRSEETSKVLKSMNTALKSCRDSVKAQAKQEKEAKKRAKLEAQIKKLQEKLKS